MPTDIEVGIGGSFCTFGQRLSGLHCKCYSPRCLCSSPARFNRRLIAEASAPAAAQPCCSLTGRAEEPDVLKAHKFLLFAAARPNQNKPREREEAQSAKSPRGSVTDPWVLTHFGEREDVRHRSEPPSAAPSAPRGQDRKLRPPPLRAEHWPFPPSLPAPAGCRPASRSVTACHVRQRRSGAEREGSGAEPPLSPAPLPLPAAGVP